MDGEIYLLEEVPPLAPRKLHTIEAIVDRLVVRSGIEARISESVHLAVRLGGGVMGAIIDHSEQSETIERLLSTPDGVCGMW